MTAKKIRKKAQGTCSMTHPFEEGNYLSPF
jgi:hypothetical protein